MYMPQKTAVMVQSVLSEAGTGSQQQVSWPTVVWGCTVSSAVRGVPAVVHVWCSPELLLLPFMGMHTVLLEVVSRPEKHASCPCAEKHVTAADCSCVPSCRVWKCSKRLHSALLNHSPQLMGS